MEIRGTVISAKTKEPLGEVKLTLSVGTTEMASLYSDGKGYFAHEEATDHIRETLTCAAEKEGFKAKTLTRTIEEQIIPLEIAMEEEDAPPKGNGKPPIKKILIGTGIGVVVLALVLVGVFVIPRFLGNGNGETVEILHQRVTGLAVKSKKSYDVVPRGLQEGAKMYVDRDSIYGYVPPSLQGKTYIRTANDDKLNRSKEFLSFLLSKPGVVYVAHDDRHSTRPSWLSGFSDTGEVVLNAEAHVQIRKFSVFAKEFPAGNVTLGGNYPDRDVGNNSMYVVIVSD